MRLNPLKKDFINQNSEQHVNKNIDVTFNQYKDKKVNYTLGL